MLADTERNATVTEDTAADTGIDTGGAPRPGRAPSRSRS